ncbi:hypothetical protein EWF20_00810 [Sulfolobus sp. S-194]|uniref:hypothetical protein n=1 Tax=Sulfolobus sp. S-194 TaxID=2512240 RepID=UPI001436EC1A|nr:hypothetical protein [Sulfolobus sp. S-194]QIW22842.1 hypothetical protein EWF20_00810 [Sulfolobus sp. S-194]
MLSLDKWEISGYINCLKQHYSDYKLVSSMAFLIAIAKGNVLYYFAPDTDGVIYSGKLEDVKSECDIYVKKFSSYSHETIKTLSLKLWNYYANKKVEFSNEEKKLLDDLGISLES